MIENNDENTEMTDEQWNEYVEECFRKGVCWMCGSGEYIQKDGKCAACRDMAGCKQ